jgi:NAD(P)H-dependent FMN reductase
LTSTLLEELPHGLFNTKGFSMTDKPLSIRVIIGSARSVRFADVMTAWVNEQLAAMPHIDVEVLDPRELNLPQGHCTDVEPAKKLRESLQSADAFIVVTPEYNRSYTGALKILIDSAYEEWNAKPVGFVCYGGISGGLRAVEQLRPVFSELHAVTTRDVVSFANPWKNVGPDGRLDAGATAITAFETMMAKLQWWAYTLKQGRELTPYRKTA